ncbi:hypothetical protein F2Q69_00003163 [Brassica cretica]|uniref:Uncharacterized protein n=1 Tax=Brassica cretica TaxID=69181 RepID=A0A8S9P482_BRACR|nr:hypothetical protein F2Q69_00003163 [Brassica cretica]
MSTPLLRINGESRPFLFFLPNSEVFLHCLRIHSGADPCNSQDQNCIRFSSPLVSMTTWIGGIYEQADIRNLKTEDQDAFLLTLAKSVFLKVVRCRLEHASAIAKASLMSKCVVVEIKEPETAAPSVWNDQKILVIQQFDAPQSMDQYMETYQIGDQADQNNSDEVRLPSRANQDDRAVYRLDPLTSGMELRPDPHPDKRTDRSSTSPSQPSRQAIANSRARLDLDHEVSQNDRDFSLDSSKARIIQLSEDLGRMSTLLDQPADCPGRSAFIQLLTATTPPWPDESGHQPKSHFDQI